MPDVARGRRMILSIVVPLVLFAFIGTFRHGLLARPTGSVVGPIVLAALGALMYRGVHWAREAIVIWLGLGTLACGVSGVFNIPRSPIQGSMLLLFAAAFACGAIMLYTSDDVEAVVNPGAFPARDPR